MADRFRPEPAFDHGAGARDGILRYIADRRGILVPSLLADRRGTLLEDVSSTAVGDALDAFERDPRPAEAAAARLREHVLAHHDVDANAARLLAVYGVDPVDPRALRPA